MASSKGYGQVSGQNEGGKKKTIAVAGVSSLVLVAMVVAVTVGVSKHNAGTGNDDFPASGDGDSSGGLHSSVKAIKAICQPTDYKETCENSLSSVAGNTTDPKELVKLAFKITVDRVKEVLQNSTMIKEAEKDPMTKKALENCEELMDYSIEDLTTSLDRIGVFDISKIDEIVEDVKVWLSAAMTYQETCLDGFQGTNSDSGEKMKKIMKVSSELTSNILAIVDQIQTVIGNLDLESLLHRRLLESEDTEEIPGWALDGGRRLLAVDSLTPNCVVAKDGSGMFKTINEALATVPLKSNTSFVIKIKEGLYKENVLVAKHMWNVVMIGDGPDKTRITGSLNFVEKTPTWQTATLAVVGDEFLAKDIGIENTAGPEGHQAVALRVQSDRSVFYNCYMDGYQDTLYTQSKRQFYRDCTISGTIDFIFGNGAVVLQNCHIVVRRPLDNQQTIITAQGRKDRKEPTALILHNCTVMADRDYLPVKDKMKTYLGRPWKAYSRTFYIQTDLGDFVDPAGWLPWESPEAVNFINTCFYAEYQNRGPAAVQSKRVKWRGIKDLTPERATKFTVMGFIRGHQWIKKSGVPYTPGLYASV